MIDIICLVNSKCVYKYNIENVGLSYIEEETHVSYFTDPFCSVPLYIAESNSKKRLYIFSRFEDFYNLVPLESLGIDIVGFWEIVLYGSGIGTRTLYKSVLQVPSASQARICKLTGDIKISRTWDFSVEVDRSLKSEKDAANFLLNAIREQFYLKVDENQHYIMGMSGGMDSRLTLAILSEILAPDQLSLFTYGFNENILEYQYATEVSSLLKFDQPVFHKLTDSSYSNAKKYLPFMSGGLIGINHCHIFDFLASIKPINSIQISTYYSDAILGWETRMGLSNSERKRNPYANQLLIFQIIESEVIEEIQEDIKNVLDGYNDRSNFSSLSEYKYIVERNPKFHVLLGYLQGQISSLVMPYASTRLLKASLSIPIEFRANKRLIDLILRNHYNALHNVGDISSRFQWGKGYASSRTFSHFKFLNALNAFLRYVTSGNYEVNNKYQTEIQEAILKRSFCNELAESTTKLVNADVLKPFQKKYLDNIPLKSQGTSERFNIITIGSLLK